jgi:hypothetical protein
MKIGGVLALKYFFEERRERERGGGREGVGLPSLY